MEVLSGHRTTLTYNLYVSEHVGGVMQKVPNADPSMYSLYQELKSMLQNPDFMKEDKTQDLLKSLLYSLGHLQQLTDALRWKAWFILCT